MTCDSGRASLRGSNHGMEAQAKPPTAMPAAADDGAAQALLDLVRAVADELRPQIRLAATLGLDHSLERDYGLDSLARVELLARIDQSFGVSLGEAPLTDAETPRDLLRFIATGRPRGAAAAAVPVAQPSGAEAGEGLVPPDTVATLQELFDWHLQRPRVVGSSP